MEPERTDLQHHILRQLRAARRPRTNVDRLCKALRVDRDELDAALEDLLTCGEVVRGPGARLALSERVGLVTGRVRLGRRGSGVVIPDIADAPLALERHAVRPALDGDRVLAQAEPHSRRRLRRATIVRVLERGRTSLIAEDDSDGPALLRCRDARIGDYLVTLTEDSPPVPHGHAVAAEIVAYPTSYSDLVVTVTEDLGPCGNLSTEIAAACSAFSIPTDFPDDVQLAARRFTEPSPTDFEGRLDLRDRVAFTIDPADAKDHDDAVSIEETEQGYRLYVSIADVGHYITPGSELDREAYDRATSTYFPGICMPMLPHALSSGLASLRPDVDRLTLTVIVDVDKSGKVRATEFAQSVIRSCARLSYEQAEAVLDATSADEISAPVREALHVMAACARALSAERTRRGAVDMDIPEAQIVLNAKGQPKRIERRPRLFAHRLIEEFMLVANEAVASRLDGTRAPFLYRIHERPDREAGFTLASRLEALGLRIKGDGNNLEPGHLQAVLQEAAKGPSSRQVSLMVLRSMARARYSADKEMHFGLASPCYTHFTSPIRRYPDLVTHRALRAEITGTPASTGGRAALRPVARHCSERERRATNAERDVAKAAAAIYMQPRVGKTFTGMVSSVDRHGYWVELEKIFVEGFVPVARLREYFDYFPDRLELCSRTSDATIRIGDAAKVRVTAVDLRSRAIDMEPV